MDCWQLMVLPLFLPYLAVTEAVEARAADCEFLLLLPPAFVLPDLPEALAPANDFPAFALLSLPPCFS